MSIEYDKYYQTENLFGNPYPELIEHYSSINPKGKLLDLGCGQGRDAIALAKLGFEVTGIDHSKIGIAQLNAVAKQENVSLKGIVSDIYQYTNFDEFGFILLDSMFHFGKKEKEKEIQLLKRIFASVKPQTQITICIQNTGNKVKILDSIISETQDIELLTQQSLVYEFEDKASDHRSKTQYEMITLQKLIFTP